MVIYCEINNTKTNETMTVCSKCRKSLLHYKIIQQFPNQYRNSVELCKEVKRELADRDINFCCKCGHKLVEATDADVVSNIYRASR